MIDTDEPYNSSLEAAEDYQDQIDTLLAEVKRLREKNEYFRGLLDYYKGELIDEHAEVMRLREIINKAMQQHTVLEMRGQLFESECIDAEGQYESGQWERDEE